VSADFTKLRSFVKAIDCGSMSRAAMLLEIAQPALSQHIASLEAYFKEKLLIRSSSGIVPTEAGFTLYRHAQAILRQLEQAKREVRQSTGSLKGHVSVGLSTYSGAVAFAVPLLFQMAERHPDVVLSINDSFGHVLSELVSLGRMDIALIYSFGPIKGVQLQPLFQEEFMLVAPKGMAFDGHPDDLLPLSALEDVKLFLPGGYHFLRRLIEMSFAHARIVPRIAAELESIATLKSAIEAGLGATIVPRSAAHSMQECEKLTVRRLTRPVVQATMSLCVSDHLPLSEAALEVREILLRLASDLANSERWVSVSAPASL
jgi:LysR family nitrogen assimilation transcriptional regulator